MKKIICILSIVLLSQNIFAKGEVKFKEVNDSIVAYFSEITKVKNDEKKEEINQKLIETLKNFLKNPESFDYPIDTIKYLSCLKSNDNALRVYSWNICYADGSFKYFGYVQQKDKGKVSFYFLNDCRNHSSVQRDAVNYLTTSEWYGCLYYEIITKVWNSKTYYTLIGWDGADMLINRKVIEVLSFTKRGIPVFEKKMFKVNRVISSKLIFEYADRATMMLRYNSKHDLIVIDHLSPPEERFNGMHRYYGPDMSYDALSFKGGRWICESDIDPNIAINFQKNSNINKIKRRGVQKGF